MAGLVEKIFGPKRAKKPASPAEQLRDAEGAIERHAAEIAAAREEIAGAERARKALLVRDGTDAEIADIEQRIAAAKLRIERLDELRSPLAARLADARDAVREAKWQEIQAEYWPVAHDFIATVRKATEMRARLERLRGAAAAAGLQFEAQHFMTIVPLHMGAIDDFDRVLREVEAAANPKPKPPPQPVEPTVLVRWLRDPDQGAGKPRQGWFGMQGLVPAGKAEKLIRDGIVEPVQLGGAPPVKVVPQPGAFAAVATSPAPDAVEPGAAESATVEQSAPKAPKANVDRAAWHASTMLLTERE